MSLQLLAEYPSIVKARVTRIVGLLFKRGGASESGASRAICHSQNSRVNTSIRAADARCILSLYAYYVLTYCMLFSLPRATPTLHARVVLDY